MIRTVIVVPTPKSEEEYKRSQPYNNLSSIPNSEFEHITIDIVSNNTKGISQIYNEKLEMYSSWDHIHNVVFMHDDVEIHDLFFQKKLQKAHEKYDVVGLAGATRQNYTKMPHGPAWHLCLDGNSSVGRGFVSHTIPANVGGYNFPYVNSSYFGPSPSEVCFVDGLFMSFKMDSFRKNPIKFKEKYTFHHYDMSACAELKKANFSIGVWPIYVVHYGLGEFQNDPLWHTLAAEFAKEYKDYDFSL